MGVYTGDINREQLMGKGRGELKRQLGFSVVEGEHNRGNRGLPGVREREAKEVVVTDNRSGER